MARYRFCSFYFAADRLWKTLDFYLDPSIMIITAAFSGHFRASNSSASSGFLALRHPMNSTVLILQDFMSFPHSVATAAGEHWSDRP
jgi:hypothetical protein